MHIAAYLLSAARLNTNPRVAESPREAIRAERVSPKAGRSRVLACRCCSAQLSPEAPSPRR